MTPEVRDVPADAAPGTGAPPAGPDPGHIPELVRTEAGRGWRALDLADLWRYRELLWFLALRDIQVRYKQTALGVAWAVLQPLFSTVVFSLIFGYLAGMKSDGIPYPVFSLCGMIPWQLFAYALTQASGSVVAEQRLITKVYFPRLVIPLASVLSGLADFAVAFVLLLIVMAGYGVTPPWQVVLVPGLVVFAVLTALAVGLWLAALNVKYRDFRYTIPFLTQVWFFATPVVYPSSLIPPAVRPVYGLNPMAGVVEGFRWAMLGTAEPSWALMGVSAVTVAVLLTGGLYYFRRVERTFSDLV